MNRNDDDSSGNGSSDVGSQDGELESVKEGSIGSRIWR